jgi:hypothetical protein
MHSLQRLFVPKDRVIKAELHLEIQQLCDVPLISGTYFARWSIRDTSGTRDRGTTERYGCNVYATCYLTDST